MTIRAPILIPDRQPAASGMFAATRPMLLGTSAAWRAPSVMDGALAELLAPAPPASVRAHTADAHRAVTMSHRALGTFARILPARWRSTCLYRSVAECLVLRALGHPARVVIGVGTDEGSVGVMAHAWVECDGFDCLSTRGAAELERMSSRQG